MAHLAQQEVQEVVLQVVLVPLLQWDQAILRRLVLLKEMMVD